MKLFSSAVCANQHLARTSVDRRDWQAFRCCSPSVIFVLDENIKDALLLSDRSLVLNEHSIVSVDNAS